MKRYSHDNGNITNSGYEFEEVLQSIFKSLDSLEDTNLSDDEKDDIVEGINQVAKDIFTKPTTNGVVRKKSVKNKSVRKKL